MFRVLICASDEQRELNSNLLEVLTQKYEVIDFSKGDSPGRDDIVFILGGDGSLNYYINSVDPMSFSNCNRVIYIPTGTANDFAKSISLQFKNIMPEDWSILFNSKVCLDIPICRVNSRYFVNGISVGEPAKITQSKSSLFKEKLGKFSYYIEAFQKVNDLENHSFHVRFENSEESFETPGFVVMQGQYLGGGIRVTPHKVPIFDENLCFTTILSNDVIELMNILFQMQKDDFALTGQIQARSFLANFFTIECDQVLEAKVDGELISDSKFEFTKTEHVLKLLTY